MSKALKYILISITVLISILTLLSLTEYINVAILKNTKDYPFGTEGPVADISYYKNASSYSWAMLYKTISGLIISITLWLGLLKEKIKMVLLGLLLILIHIIVTYILY